jgi:hypothetical protein
MSRGWLFVVRQTLVCRMPQGQQFGTKRQTEVCRTEERCHEYRILAHRNRRSRPGAITASESKSAAFNQSWQPETRCWIASMRPRTRRGSNPRFAASEYRTARSAGNCQALRQDYKGIQTRGRPDGINPERPEQLAGTVGRGSRQKQSSSVTLEQ